MKYTISTCYSEVGVTRLFFGKICECTAGWISPGSVSELYVF